MSCFASAWNGGVGDSAIRVAIPAVSGIMTDERMKKIELVFGRTRVDLEGGGPRVRPPEPQGA